MKRLLIVALAVSSASCVGALQGANPFNTGGTVVPQFVSRFTVSTTTGANVAHLSIVAHPDLVPGVTLACPAIAVDLADCAFTQGNGTGFSADVVGDGFALQTVRGVIGQPVSVTLAPNFPAPPTRQQLLTMQTAMYGLRCTVPSLGGDIPWFDPGIQALGPEERQAVYACKHGRGDTGIISGPGLYAQVLYDEPGNPYQVSIPTFDIAERVIEHVRNGFWTDLYLDGDAMGWQVAMEEFPIVYQKLLHGGPNGEDLNRYVNYRPAWDGWFYGIPETQIVQWAAMARKTCPSCVITFEFNTGHIPFGEGNGDFLPGGRMQDFDGVKVEFDMDLHNDNTWQILARLLGPAYHHPADDPNGPAPWYLDHPTVRGPWGVECFEPPTYDFVRNRLTQTRTDDDRAYLIALGCPAVD